MRILVLEDDHKVATFIQRGLEEEGYAVDVLHDGLQAGVQTQSIDYDAAVLDLMPPAPPGLQVLHDIRATKRELPVVVLSARDSLEDRVAVSTPVPTTIWPSRSLLPSSRRGCGLCCDGEDRMRTCCV